MRKIGSTIEKRLLSTSLRWALVPILFAVVYFGQEYWDYGTKPRADFYFVGMAAWRLFFCSAFLVDRIFAPNRIVQFIWAAFFIMLAYILYDEFVNSGYGVGSIYAGVVSLASFFLFCFLSVYKVLFKRYPEKVHE